MALLTCVNIDMRYFWLKERVGKGEISVKYCPTELMLADFRFKISYFFSKPRRIIQKT